MGSPGMGNGCFLQDFYTDGQQELHDLCPPHIPVRQRPRIQHFLLCPSLHSFLAILLSFMLHKPIITQHELGSCNLLPTSSA